MQIITKAATAFALLVVLSTAPTAPAWADQIFRSRQYKFRFVYPDAWIRKKPKGRHTRALVSANSPTGGNCNVVVKAIPELRGLSQNKLNELLKETINKKFVLEVLQERYSKFLLHSIGDTHVDNIPARHHTSTGNYSTVAGTVQIKMWQVYVFRPGHIYTITCGARAANFKSNWPILLRIMSSFVFEDW